MTRRIGIDNRLYQFLRETKMDKFYPLSRFKDLDLNPPDNSRLSPHRGMGRLLRPKYSVLAKLSHLVSRCIEDVWNYNCRYIQVSIGTCRLNRSIWKCLLQRLISPHDLLDRVKTVDRLVHENFSCEAEDFNNKFYVVSHRTNLKLIYDISSIKLSRNRLRFSRSSSSNLLITRTNPLVRGFRFLKELTVSV